MTVDKYYVLSIALGDSAPDKETEKLLAVMYELIVNSKKQKKGSLADLIGKAPFFNAHQYSN